MNEDSLRVITRAIGSPSITAKTCGKNHDDDDDVVQ